MTENHKPTVFVVDDDEGVREGLRILLESAGHQVALYPDAMSFLNDYNQDRPGCLILDIRMPGMDGLDLQDELVSRRIMIPTIILTGHGDIPASVRAMKSGAMDFFEKPFDDRKLLETVNNAIAKDDEQRNKYIERSSVEARISTLTNRETDVLERLVAGQTTKQIAREFEVSTQAIDAHRQRILRKMEVESAPALLRLVLSAGLDVEDVRAAANSGRMISH